jgi:hypothetical protein
LPIHWDKAIVPVLGLDRFDLFPKKVDLSPLQSQYLTAPHTSVERNSNDRPEVLGFTVKHFPQTCFLVW